jgi:predicted NAD/FAD-binding protein
MIQFRPCGVAIREQREKANRMGGTIEARRSIAVVGGGISGLSAAWLLSQRHDVTLFERDARIGGHAHTVEVLDTAGRSVPVDTGFIVFNEATYPNFTALLAHLGVDTAATQMSFAVSLDSGRLEYSGTGLGGLFAQRRNIVSPRFWSMLQDLVRFYRSAPRDAVSLPDETVSLGDYLKAGQYGRAFLDDHLLPMAGAIWSAPCAEILSYPATAFIRFHDNHGLLRLSGRPMWRTIAGGSREYVGKLRAQFRGEVHAGDAVSSIQRTASGAVVLGSAGLSRTFDDVVIATHANDALALLADPSPEERRLLGAFRYSRNVAVLHRDEKLMPHRRAAWSSWNHLGDRGAPASPCVVTYWMNRLQPLDTGDQFFVTLNPTRPPRPERVLKEQVYEHPLFDAAALAAQKELWSLQGIRRTWFCGAHFGAGFHEDGLQSGLAVAEAMSDVRRPWTVADASGRIPVARQADQPVRFAQSTEAA